MIALIRKVPLLVWGAIAATLLCALILAGTFHAGGKAERRAHALREAKAETVATQKTGEAQRELDRTIVAIGDGVARRDTETVRVVERVRVEIRDAAVATPDAGPRLAAFAERIGRLRDDCHLDGPAGADSGGAACDPGALRLAGPSHP